MAINWVKVNGTYEPYKDMYDSITLLTVTSGSPTGTSEASVYVAPNVRHNTFYNSSAHSNGVNLFFYKLFEGMSTSYPISSATIQLNTNMTNSGYGSSWAFQLLRKGYGSDIYLALIGTPSSVGENGFCRISITLGGTSYSKAIALKDSTSQAGFNSFRTQHGVKYLVQAQYYTYSYKVSTYLSGAGPNFNEMSLFMNCGPLYFPCEDNNYVGENPVFRRTDNLRWVSYIGVPCYTITGSSTTYTISQLSFVISFNYRKYTSNTASELVNIGTAVLGEKLTLPTMDKGNRPNYDFGTWRYNNEDLGTSPTEITTHPSQTTIESVWTGKWYTVSFSIDSTKNPSPSSIPSRSVQYPNTTSLPTSVTSTHYNFNGWLDSNVLVATNYQPTKNVTLVASFSAKSYSVKFYSCDGNVRSQYSVAYGNSVNVPSKELNTPFTFKGWAVKSDTSKTPVITTQTTYAPSGNVELIELYTYSLTLKNTRKSWSHVIYGENYFTGTFNIPLPPSVSVNVPAESGFNLIGWSTSEHTPDVKVNRTGTQGTFSNSVTISKSTTFSTLYAEYASVLLESLTMDTESLTMKTSDVSRLVNIKRSNLNPNTWLGDVYWAIFVGTQKIIVLPALDTDNTNPKYVTSYFTFEVNPASSVDSSTIASATIYPTSGTSELQVPYSIGIVGRKYEWDEHSELIQSNLTYINISDLIPIQFKLLKGGKAYNLPVKATVGGTEYVIHEGATWYVDDTDGVRSWALASALPQGLDEPPEGALFPIDPSRQGYIFAGWMDNDGNKVDETRIPKYATTCYATWTKSYYPQDRDVLIFQLFNKAGDGMDEQIDMGNVTSFSESCNPSMTSSPTPTMSSDNTFILDTEVSAETVLEVRRKNPDHPNDSSDEPSEWSNGKWLTQIRKIVDRWQSETDGIKILYLPRGFKVKTIFPNTPFERTFGYGDNYPMAGYVKENNDNLGLIYTDNNKSYKLVGFNGVISAFSDKPSNDTNRVIVVNITITLGGMTSNYEKYIPIIGGQ